MNTKDYEVLNSLIKHYIDGFDKTREDNDYLGNFLFQEKYGLCLKVPETWPLSQVITDLINEYQDKAELDVVVIYPTTNVYKAISDKIKMPISYCSWQEIYVARDLANRDVRQINKYKEMLTGANLVIFLGPPAEASDIVDQIRTFCSGCLIMFELHGDIS